MDTSMKSQGKVLTLFAATLAISACATTGAPPPPPAPTSNVEVQDEVGFTITEEGQASLELQAEYDALWALTRRNVSQAAREARLDRHHLKDLLKKHGIKTK